MAWQRWIQRLFERRARPRLQVEAGSLREALVGLLTRLRSKQIDCALVGGVALAARGVVRGTRDLDLLIDKEAEPDVHGIMSELGFEALDRGQSVSSYVLGPLRVDFLLAGRARGRGMLERAELVPVTAAVSVKVVQVEDLISLKLQALIDNPQRGRDRADIEALLITNQTNINMEAVRDYAAALGAERELEEILATISARAR